MSQHHPPSSDPNSSATKASASAMESCVVCVPKSHIELELHPSTGSGIDLIVSISATGLSGSPSFPPKRRYTSHKTAHPEQAQHH